MKKNDKKCRNSECGKSFTPRFSSLEKYCSFQCSKVGKPKQAPKSKIKPISDKRKKETAEYLKKRIEFLNKPENRICPVTGKSTTEVHHMAGRIGSLYLDESNWIAVSREGHQRIELNPEWAKENGFSKSRL